MANYQRRATTVNSSQETEGLEDFGGGNSTLSDRSRRGWTDKEEAVLIMAMKELVATGWKSDNGFRSGYLTVVENIMRQHFPNTDLRVHPHIKSKFTTWKKAYYALDSILSRSGVGFNVNNDFKIDCDDEQWSQIVKGDVNTRYMRNKAWPYWEDWKEVFGKDRASGGGSVPTRQAIKKIYPTNNNLTDDVSDVYRVNCDFLDGEAVPEGFFPDTVEETQSNNETSTPKSAKKSGKKRKLDDQLDKVLDLMNRMHDETTQQLKNLTAKIGYEFDLSNKRTEVPDLLDVIPGLTLKEKYDVCAKLVKEPELLDLFKGLAESARPSFVMYLLELDNNK